MITSSSQQTPVIRANSFNADLCPAMPSIFHSDAGCGCHMCRHVAPRRWILRRNWNFFPSTRIQSNARVRLDFSFATIAQFCARPCINRRTACNTVCRADIDDIFEIHEMLLRLAPPRFILFNFFLLTLSFYMKVWLYILYLKLYYWSSRRRNYSVSYFK